MLPSGIRTKTNDVSDIHLMTLGWPFEIRPAVMRCHFISQIYGQPGYYV